MVVLCFFMKRNSQPPICGIHNVALVERKMPVDLLAQHLGYVTVYVCPESGQVVTE